MLESQCMQCSVHHSSYHCRVRAASRLQVEATSDFSNTPLLYASREGHAAIVAMLLERGADVRRAKRNGETPLLLAAEAGHAGIVRLLVSRGADVGAARKSSGETALTRAAEMGHEEVVGILTAAATGVDTAG